MFFSKSRGAVWGGPYAPYKTTYQIVGRGMEVSSADVYRGQPGAWSHAWVSTRPYQEEYTNGATIARLFEQACRECACWTPYTEDVSSALEDREVCLRMEEKVFLPLIFKESGVEMFRAYPKTNLSTALAKLGVGSIQEFARSRWGIEFPGETYSLPHGGKRGGACDPTQIVNVFFHGDTEVAKLLALPRWNIIDQP